MRCQPGASGVCRQREQTAHAFPTAHWRGWEAGNSHQADGKLDKCNLEEIFRNEDALHKFKKCGCLARWWGTFVCAQLLSRTIAQERTGGGALGSSADLHPDWSTAGLQCYLLSTAQVQVERHHPKLLHVCAAPQQQPTSKKHNFNKWSYSNLELHLWKITKWSVFLIECFPTFATEFPFNLQRSKHWKHREKANEAFQVITAHAVICIDKIQPVRVSKSLLVQRNHHPQRKEIIPSPPLILVLFNSINIAH